jgi:two-component system OmpR family sensor kinase
MLADRLDFLIGVGHDMRAPLTGIAGFAAVLAELDSVAADPTAGEAVTYIRREAQRLVELLNQLLDFGHVEQGGPNLDREPIDLVGMARQSVEPWAIRHPQVNFKLVHHGDVVVEGDFLKLHRVLANLLDNAVRHSPDGGTITVDVGRDGSEAFVSVADEGPGVPVADRDRVFERFVRLPGDPYLMGGPYQNRTRGRAGAGIGLYVVRGLVEAHGGSVSVVEGPIEKGRLQGNVGALFVVKLPVRQVDMNQADMEHDPNQEALAR